MNKCWLLLKVQLLGLFNINVLWHGNKKEKRYIWLIAVSIAVLGLFIIGYSTGLSLAFASMGLIHLVPSLMLMVSTLATLLLTFLISSNILFGFHDYDQVMSFPVKSSIVIISRLLTVYLTSFILSALAIAPSVIIYGTTAKAPLSVWIMMSLTLFIAPVLPIIIAVFIGAAIAAFSVRFRYKSILSILLSIVFIILFLALTASIPTDADGIDLLAEIGLTLDNTISSIYPPAHLFKLAIVNNDWMRYGLFVLISVIPAIIFVTILSKLFVKINSALFSSKSRSNYRINQLKVSTPFKALYIKELRRLYSSPIYFLNSSIGIVLMVVMSIALSFINIEAIETALQVPDFMLYLKNLAPLILCAFIALSSTTSAAMNLEGKSRWIPFSMPVDALTIFKAKIAANLTIDIPAIIISAVLFIKLLDSNVTEAFFLFATPIIFACFIAVLGLKYNLKFPKYDWTSEQHAVKQSFSVVATFGTGFIVLIIPIAIAVTASDYASLVVMFLTLLSLLAACILYRQLKRVRLFM